MLKFSFILIILFLQYLPYYTQCPNNLIKNGSFELDSVGEAITGMFWTTLDGTPDIEDAADSNLPNGATYDFGEPKSSDDGGNWQILGSYFPESQNQDTLNESIGQIIKLERSIPHQLSFEYVSMAFLDSGIEGWYGAIDVFINGELYFTTDISSSLYNFETAFFVFTPTVQDILLEFRISKTVNPTTLKIMGIDGICLKPITTGFFCEP